MVGQLAAAAKKHGLDIAGGTVRRTSSRFCLGVEHGDYNGTELFGVRTGVRSHPAPGLIPHFYCNH
jgi:galactokinase